jgi:hypothetical protein
MECFRVVQKIGGSNKLESETERTGAKEMSKGWG